MELFLREKLYCCGCEACAQVCAQEAIEMIQDEEGFFYPKIDRSKCISCGRCASVCPYTKERKKDEFIMNPYVLGIKNKSYYKRMKESSGGFFSVLCEYVQNKKGVIYGVEWAKDEIRSAKYGRTEEKFESFYGSKYLQSRKYDIYTQVNVDLKNDKWVLFTGTPCDNEALKRYLDLNGTGTNRLLSVDIVCGGVPSPEIFAEYIDYLQTIYMSDVKEYYFRDKGSEGWERFGTKAKFANGTEYFVPSLKDFYFTLFDKHYISRLACYNCQWASTDRKTDFTLADFWGINKIDPDFMDDAGVSLVLVNSDKAKAVFAEIRDKVEYKKYKKELAAQHNPCLTAPIPYPKNRDKFWEYYRKNGLTKLVKDYWLQWKVIEWILNKFQITGIVIDLSVNKNWILHEAKREKKELEIIEIFVEKNHNCIIMNSAQSDQKWNQEILLNKNVGLLRLDLEGLEYDFLERLEPVILRDKPIIISELMRKWAKKYKFDSNEILLRLNKYGYKCYAVAEDCSIKPVSRISNAMEERWFLFVMQDIEL